MTKNNVLEKVTKKQLLTPENTMYYTILHQNSTQPPKGPQVHYLTYISYYHILQQKQYPASKKVLRYITLQIYTTKPDHQLNYTKISCTLQNALP